MEESLSQSQLERLHEYCGLCFHDKEGIGGRCSKCKNWVKETPWANFGTVEPNCTFTTPADLIALGKRIAEKGEWKKFRNFVEYEWWKDETDMTDDWSEWLIFSDDSRLAKLFCKFKGWE